MAVVVSAVGVDVDGGVGDVCVCVVVFGAVGGFYSSFPVVYGGGCFGVVVLVSRGAGGSACGFAVVGEQGAVGDSGAFVFFEAPFVG